MIITIDGPVATGKSSIAKKLAETIGYIFFDTGAMYRAVTYGLLKNKIDSSQPDQLQRYLDSFKLEIRIHHGERSYFLESEDITLKIRGRDVTQIVSEISAQKAVRNKLIEIQRKMAVGVNAVFEGRDMGTVVFPNATLKIFLTGRNEVRAKRRYDELITKFPEEAKYLTLEMCLEEINKRDVLDSTREHAPLRQAQDAHVIDTSDLTMDEVVDQILEIRDSLKTSA